MSASRRHPARRGFTIVELLAVIAVIALAIALLLPMSRGASGAARRAQCTNNLKQIGLALYNYEQTYKALPPAYTVDAKGRPLHSWRTLILPFLEQQSLYDTIDLTKPWDDPANAGAAKAEILAYRCPSAELKEGHTTTYLAIASPTAALRPGVPRPLAEITDGTSRTLLIVEVPAARAVPWMAPIDASEVAVVGMAASKAHNHPTGFNAALADGSVRFLKATTPPDVLRALMTVAGGEDLSSDQY
jgi:prepilin-type N-terminal cleavage/methylation domain-containing protein